MGASLKIGSIELTSLTDASITRFPMTLSQLFPSVPSAAWEPYRSRYASLFPEPDTWAAHIGCYLARSHGRTILIDAGIGRGGTPAAEFLGVEGHLPERLEALGLSPSDIDTVVLTHLHFDHIGWCVSYDGGEARLMFPNARHIVHRADWEAFQRPEVQAAIPFPYIPDMATPLERLGNLELIEGDYRLTDEISITPTPGHTPGSVSVLLSSDGARAIMWGDAFVHPATITEPGWGFAFEMDMDQAAKTRVSLLDRIEAEGMKVIACHFPEPGFGSIVRLAGKRYWQGL